MVNIKLIIESNESRAGRAFDLFIQILIIISLLSFTIETLPGLSEATINNLEIIEIFCISIFTIEYILRVLVATRKSQFIFSFYGIIDLLAILPFYFASGVDLRSIRAFRLLRLIRILKLARYNNALERLHKAFKEAKEELILFFTTTLIILYLAGVGIYLFENPIQPENFSSILHSLWWAVATLTTVGYGDVYPITAGGKIFTFFLLMIGLGIVSMPAAIIASALSKIRATENIE